MTVLVLVSLWCSISGVGLGFWVLGFTFIGYLSVESIFPVSSVGDDLSSAVGQQNFVLTVDNISVACLFSVVVVSVVVFDGIGKVVWHWWTLIIVIERIHVLVLNV